MTSSYRGRWNTKTPLTLSSDCVLAEDVSTSATEAATAVGDEICFSDDHTYYSCVRDKWGWSCGALDSEGTLALPVSDNYMPIKTDLDNHGTEAGTNDTTFSQTGSCFMYDNEGVLRPVASGVPLIDGAAVTLDGATPPNVTAISLSGSEIGYPPQPTRSNLALWYSQLDNLTINNSPGMTSVTSLDATAPGGYSTLITEDVGVGLFDNINLIFYTDTKNLNDKIYMELYVKDVDAEQCHIRHGTTDEEFVSITADNPYVTFDNGFDAFTKTVNFNGVTDWVKINVTFNYKGTSNPALLLRFYPADFADSNGKKIKIAALQVSKNRPIDRPIVTAGSIVTRNATTLQIPIASFDGAGVNTAVIEIIPAAGVNTVYESSVGGELDVAYNTTTQQLTFNSVTFDVPYTGDCVTDPLFVGLVFDTSADTAKVYSDGVLRGDKSVTFSALTSTHVYLGTDSGADNPKYFVQHSLRKGSVPEWKIIEETTPWT